MWLRAQHVPQGACFVVTSPSSWSLVSLQKTVIDSQGTAGQKIRQLLRAPRTEEKRREKLS